MVVQTQLRRQEWKRNAVFTGYSGSEGIDEGVVTRTRGSGLPPNLMLRPSIFRVLRMLVLMASMSSRSSIRIPRRVSEKKIAIPVRRLNSSNVRSSFTLLHVRQHTTLLARRSPPFALVGIT